MYCSSIWISVVLGIIIGVAYLAGLGYTLRELSKTKEIYARYTDVEEVAGAEVAARAETAVGTEDVARAEAAAGVMTIVIWKFLAWFAEVVATSFVTCLSYIKSGSSILVS